MQLLSVQLFLTSYTIGKDFLSDGLYRYHCRLCAGMERAAEEICEERIRADGAVFRIDYGQLYCPCQRHIHHSHRSKVSGYYYDGVWVWSSLDDGRCVACPVKTSASVRSDYGMGRRYCCYPDFGYNGRYLYRHWNDSYFLIV